MGAQRVPCAGLGHSSWQNIAGKIVPGVPASLLPAHRVLPTSKFPPLHTSFAPTAVFADTASSGAVDNDHGTSLNLAAGDGSRQMEMEIPRGLIPGDEGKILEGYASFIAALTGLDDLAFAFVVAVAADGEGPAAPAVIWRGIMQGTAQETRLAENTVGTTTAQRQASLRVFDADADADTYDGRIPIAESSLDFVVEIDLHLENNGGHGRIQAGKLSPMGRVS